MLHISEHFEYYNQDHLEVFRRLKDWRGYYDLGILQDRIYFDNHQKRQCIEVSLSKENENHQYLCNISSSYFIGLDRLTKLGFPVYIEPKLNNKKQQINYIEMLLEALKEPENFEHLENLVTTKFDDEWIEIENHLQPILTPFLIAQFLSVTKDIVKKGLKKSYYDVEENLNNKVKGKILVRQQIRQNTLKNRFTKTVCKFQNFGNDIEINQFLKFVMNHIASCLNDFLPHQPIKGSLNQIMRYCMGGFQQVSHKSFTKLKYKERNPFYKNYNIAVQLGNQILALQDYNISRNSNSEKCIHPPFWIDMSKLFELYVFKELRKKFPGINEVKYHNKFNKQELDFIINTPIIKAVVDAKYKPRYKDGNPSMNDARQLAGYTRLHKVYDELGIGGDRLIPAYFIYPENLPELIHYEDPDNTIEDIFEDSILNVALIDEKTVRSSTTYRQMYMQGIDLPFTRSSDI
ncbi:5-methylcytosine restriction system specificity protein McrC [Chryseobacterium sp. NFX27]|uniref:5-methylcytosine restriction system specificity protein McrC n=1 Tax=Chryseobacterium sp. NFX27 TaxID=2819618 RepID=UPI003CF2CA3D